MMIEPSTIRAAFFELECRFKSTEVILLAPQQVFTLADDVGIQYDIGGESETLVASIKAAKLSIFAIWAENPRRYTC